MTSYIEKWGEKARETEEIKLAMDLLIQLEMMEYTKEGVYIVKNFAKHQNIKIKEKDRFRIKLRIGRQRNSRRRGLHFG